MKQKLPKEIFVIWEGDKGDQFLNATETTKGIEDGTQVGIYKLVVVRRQQVTEELV